MFSTEQRRRRMVRRHCLDGSAPDALAAVTAVTAFHSSDPVTPYLGVRARMEGFTTGRLDDLLWERRTLWRLHAMRRTLFLVPAAAAPDFLGGASAGVARREHERVVGWLAADMGEGKARRWLETAKQEVVGFLESEGGEWRVQDLTEALPSIGRTVRVGGGKWATDTPVSSRLLYLLGMEGRVVRTRPAGSWRSSQYRWAATSVWFGSMPQIGDPAAHRAEIVRMYLRSFGPATTGDIRWWTGWTARDCKAALDAVEATTVELDDGEQGWVLGGDTEEDGPPTDAVAFLPGLDPTPMGWKHRDWFLGPHGDQLFDDAGNIGPSIWLGGRIVGGWAQTADGKVVYELLEEVDGRDADRVAEEAARLEEWLGGEVASVRFRTPLERRLSGR